MFKTDNSLHVFVGPNSATEDASFQDDVTASASTGSGSIFVVNEVGAAHNGALVAGDYFKVGQKHADGSVSYSPLVKFDNCSFSGKATVARSEQATTFGFNGTSGSIDAVNSNRYTVRVNFTNDADLFSQQSDLHFFEYVSDASATEQEIVDYIAQKMGKTQKLGGKSSGKDRSLAKVERLNTATSAGAQLNAGTDGTFTNGSKIVSCTNVDADAACIAGNYISVLASGGSPADTDPIYKIVSIDATNNFLELDQPYQGASGTAGDTSLYVVTAAAAAAGSAGIKVTGLAQEFKLGLLMDSVVTFEVSLDGWGASTAVATTAAVKGSGIGNEIAELEWFAKGSQGAPYHKGALPSNADNLTYYASTSAVYDMVECDCTIDAPKYAVAGAGVGRAQIVVALTNDLHATDAAEANVLFGLTSVFNA